MRITIHDARDDVILDISKGEVTKILLNPCKVKNIIEILSETLSMVTNTSWDDTVLKEFYEIKPVPDYGLEYVTKELRCDNIKKSVKIKIPCNLFNTQLINKMSWLMENVDSKDTFINSVEDLYNKMYSVGMLSPSETLHIVRKRCHGFGWFI